MFKISAKTLGAVGLKDFCPRCFYLQYKVKTAPWSIFPGIFSSIDSYTKKCVHSLIDRGAHNNSYLAAMGDIKQYHKPPHWSKFTKEYPQFDIILSGGMDDIFELTDGTFVIPDYKTAKYTENADALLPMYQIQLNAYKEIAEAGFFPNVSALYLVYFEPQTDDTDAAFNSGQLYFDMEFKPKIVPVEINKPQLEAALDVASQILKSPTPPAGKEGCKDCIAIDEIIYLTKSK
jgi:CRISPR/Cas system-associated exonuclease Cas4 (RecB family)